MKQMKKELSLFLFAGKVSLIRLLRNFFTRPKVSSIDLDDYGSFVWGIIDDKKDIYTLSKELDQKFPNMEKSLSRLIKFLEILKDHHLITYSEKKSNSNTKTC